MATEKQIKANRENAQKSTGPKTPEGKSVSSRNALKTGKFAKSTAAQSMAAQMAAEYKRLTEEFTRDFDPKTLEERFYVRNLAHAAWQGRLYNRAETDIWNMNFIEGGSKDENSMDRVFMRAAKDLDRIGRLIESADKNFYWALDRLLAIRDRKNVTSNTRRPAASQPRPPNSALFLIS